MSFVAKYKESIEIANIAYNKNKYNSAVNRYYYGIYQKMLDRIQNSCTNSNINSNNMNQENTHNQVITFFRDNVLAPKYTGKERIKKKYLFNSYIQDLKRLRHKADYNSALLTKKDADDAIKKFEELDKIV